MKKRNLILTCLCALPFVAVMATERIYERVPVEAPFPMDSVTLCSFPEKDFVITRYGAVEGGEKINTRAIAKAIEACNRAGGGRVVVPEGEWLTGPIHLKSNVNLHLQEGAVLRFSDNPADYLPAVMTSWEGLECYNYSPLVYAFGCENVAITGSGTLAPKMDTWRVWFKRPQAHLHALAQLYSMGSTDVPVEQRQMAQGENNLRPHLIHFNRCNHVLLDGFKIRQSPFWTIHLYLCNSGVVRNLDVQAHGHNNDGIDFEMSRNFLVEHCTFDQGDDAVVIKSRLFFLKTNHRRGGFIENIYLENIEAGDMLRAFEIDTDVLYQWKDLVPTYERKLTRIRGIYMKNVHCKSADAIYELKGEAEEPIRDVFIEQVKVDTVRQFVNRIHHVEGLHENGVSYDVLLRK